MDFTCASVRANFGMMPGLKALDDFGTGIQYRLGQISLIRCDCRSVRQV